VAAPSYPHLITSSPSARRLEVASVQLSSQGRISENLAVCAELCAVAASKGAKLVVLPENFAFMGPESERSTHAEVLGDVDAPIQRALASLARRHSIFLVGGGMPERSENADRPFNTCVVVDPSGAVVGSYRKIHLFDVDLADGTTLRESASTTPGTEPMLVRVDDFGVGLSICYDLRFPELYRALIGLGAEVMLAPSAFTLHTGKDHWHVLLRARAIESQCYVVAAAQWGKHPLGRTTYGHALVADPWGTVIAECSDGRGVAIGTIDAGRIASVRASLPSLEHRKL
jgi:predicted amidohydrolase